MLTMGTCNVTVGYMEGVAKWHISRTINLLLLGVRLMEIGLEPCLSGPTLEIVFPLITHVSIAQGNLDTPTDLLARKTRYISLMPVICRRCHDELGQAPNSSLRYLWPRVDT